MYPFYPCFDPWYYGYHHRRHHHHHHHHHHHCERWHDLNRHYMFMVMDGYRGSPYWYR